VLLVGSSGYLEMSVNRGSAAEHTGVKRGDAVRLRRQGGEAPRGNGEPEGRT
jgi:S-adenosylmethionine hydrolase